MNVSTCFLTAVFKAFLFKANTISIVAADHVDDVVAASDRAAVDVSCLQPTTIVAWLYEWNTSFLQFCL